MTHKPLFFLFLIPLVVGYCVYLDYEISEQSKVYCSQKINDEQVINDCYKTKGEMIKAVYDCIRDGYDGVCYAVYNDEYFDDGSGCAITSLMVDLCIGTKNHHIFNDTVYLYPNNTYRIDP